MSEQKNSSPTLFKRSRTVLKDILENEDAFAYEGKDVTVCGWMQTMRKQGEKMAFVELNDGSCPGNLQVLVQKGEDEARNQKVEGVFAKGGTGVSCKVNGKIVKSVAKGQAIELKAESVTILGGVDAATYPIPKKKLTLEYMRENQNWRIRTRTMRAVQNIRNQCAWATHSFFQGHGFKYVHTPLLTGADCEGAGEMFSVTNLIKEGSKISDIPVVMDAEKKTDKIDYSKDFFGKPVSLTVSGQLNVETYACAFSDVYTFGPTFRAEKSKTTRHLAEFWMIEPEIAFATLEDDMALAEDYVKYCVQSVLTKCANDVQLLTDYHQREFAQAKKRGKVAKDALAPSKLKDSLQVLLGKPYKRLTYTEAIAILEKEIAEYRAIVITEEEAKKMKAKDLKKKTKGKHRFEFPVFWGVDLASEHEKFLTDKIFNAPVILYNYPKDIKAFYMKMNEDNKTVQAMDMLVPGIGELIGGSAREDNYDVLVKRCAELKMDTKPLQWYLDLRKYGSVPHAGFGLGFERLVMLVTGMSNIKDVIPFPRAWGLCDF
mmetsp:Transcript_25402/g.40741  ORF Transcript_25402/g.40741 Transcript_25402/m.40741 type:complete len:544 (-) Transcript_25402:100-1731(-)